jgi:hypothetical protein
VAGANAASGTPNDLIDCEFLLGPEVSQRLALRRPKHAEPHLFAALLLYINAAAALPAA